MNKTCNRCVMDTTDPKIIFDNSGICNHCNEFDTVTKKLWFPNSQGQKLLQELFNKIKLERTDYEYDCILGLSGGLDSAYLALILKDYGLTPLLIHIDAGWNTEFAEKNIQSIVAHCGFDLKTITMDWEEIQDLQLSYLQAGVANQDVIQDHAFFACLYDFAIQNNIPYVINGGNIATESIFPSSWHHSAMDSINLKAIHKKYGKRKLKNYKTVSFFDYYFYYPFIKKMKVIRPLNYLPYSKEIALERLTTIGYIPYARKHGESYFTKFFQNHYLPAKFNMDKRKPHLSSLIVSGLLSREDALKALQEPLYDEQELIDDKKFIASKLEISIDELNNFINTKGHHYSEYPNWDNKYRFMKKCQNTISTLSGKKLNAYS